MGTLLDEFNEDILDEDLDHLIYLMTKDYCLLVHESGTVIVCSGHEHAQRHPNFCKPGWRLEDGTYLIVDRSNKFLEHTKWMLQGEYWGS